MAGRMKTGLVLAGLLASCVTLGTGCKRAEAEARPQDLLQPQQDEGTRDRSGTGGTGTTQDEGTLDEPGTGGSFDQGTADEDMMDEPGTGGAGEDTVREEDEGVLQPGVRDEGLDHDEGQADEDTVYQGTRQPPED
ncbi:hypothetical protein [Archangium sp.]|uniref:hypothetical protein n=1 Tax=Archangium sp. TaxID=1872627 RepID=UPI002D4D428F|nr:hypothetical protein [Archangium sp.]HYO56345.1 hypothetical protein [Archangium sp.]